jgi:hypothetical protein
MAEKSQDRLIKVPAKRRRASSMGTMVKTMVSMDSTEFQACRQMLGQAVGGGPDGAHNGPQREPLQLG